MGYFWELKCEIIIVKKRLIDKVFHFLGIPTVFASDFWYFLWESGFLLL